ncbi:YbjN domain-containing protein [Thermus sp.]
MRAGLFLVLALGAALAQAFLKGITHEELEGVLKAAEIPYERTDEGQYRLEMAGLEKVWLYMDYCQEERCGVLTLSAGFTLEGPPGLDLLNAWNRDRRFSRAFLDEEGAVWVESDLDLTGGVSLGAVKAFLELFAEEILPGFMEHIGFEP